MNCQPVLSASRRRKSSKTSPQASAWSTALSVSTPSRSKRQALTVPASRASCCSAVRARATAPAGSQRRGQRAASSSAVCRRSRASSSRRCTSSEAGSVPARGAERAPGRVERQLPPRRDRVQLLRVQRRLRRRRLCVDLRPVGFGVAARAARGVAVRVRLVAARGVTGGTAIPATTSHPAGGCRRPLRLRSGRPPRPPRPRRPRARREARRYGRRRSG